MTVHVRLHINWLISIHASIHTHQHMRCEYIFLHYKMLGHKMFAVQSSMSAAYWHWVLRMDSDILLIANGAKLSLCGVNVCAVRWWLQLCRFSVDVVRWWWCCFAWFGRLKMFFNDLLIHSPYALAIKCSPNGTASTLGGRSDFGKT